MEKRQVTTQINLRSLSEDTEGTVEPVIEGYALEFNKQSEVLGGFTSFRETIDPHALDNADMSNVLATFNHDQSQPLARSGVNMTLEVDDIGLKFVIEPLNTTLTRDLAELIGKGVINQCSFAFTIPDVEGSEDWVESNEEGVDYERTVRSIDHLYDVSIVSTPAYADTVVSVGARSKELVNEIEADKAEQLAKANEWKNERSKMLLKIEKEAILKEVN